MNVCIKLVNYFHYVCAKFHQNWTTFSERGLARKKKWSKKKAQTSRDARPIRLPIIKSWVKGNLGSWDFTCSLVNYLQFVCAKNHPKRTNFRVKRLASKKVQTKGSNFTRCSTYSASNDKISIQRELKKLKLCMYPINYFHFVCVKNHQNRSHFRVKRLASKKVKTKVSNFTRWSTYSASDDKISSQGKLKKMKLCM